MTDENVKTDDLVCEVSEWLQDPSSIEGIRWEKTIQIGICKISFELRMDGHWGRDGEFVTRHRYCFFQTGTDNDGKFPKAEYFKVNDLDEAKKLADRYILGVVEKGQQFLKGVGTDLQFEKPITKDDQVSVLTDQDAWALAHFAQFPTMAVEHKEKILNSLSPEGKRLVQTMFDVISGETPDSQHSDIKVVKGFLNWARSLGKRSGQKSS